MTLLLNRISQDLCLDTDYILSIIRRSNFYYKDFVIPKKDGSPRRISQASPELKSLQYWVINNIIKYLPTSTSSFAYKSGDSIKRHAYFHKNSKFLFHTDIRHFFPNITPSLLITQFEYNQRLLMCKGLWYDDLYDTVTKICFRFNKLCIGTVSSPMISNVIMYNFDECINSYCTDLGYKYSRYADDIYISSNIYIPKTIQSFVSDELSKLDFLINIKKTWFKSKKSQRRISGLILTDRGRISVGYNTRCDIKKMIYNRIINGDGDPDIILGHLAFLQDIEPVVYNKYLIKYAPYCNGDVIAAIKSGPIPETRDYHSIELPNIL